MLNVFTPAGPSSTIAATSTSANVKLNGQQKNVRVCNTGTKEAFIAFGTASSLTATAGGGSTAANDGSMSVPAGFTGIFCLGNATYVAAICGGTDTTTIRLTPGDGGF